MRRYPIHVLSTAVLLLASSCVAPSKPYRISQDIPEPDGRVLLRRLALDVPEGTPLAPGAAATGPLSAAPSFTESQSPDDAARALECLTAAIYYEARSESRDGQRAVAQVVLNRVRDRAFPKSVCGVVYQGSKRSTGCQFSFTCDGSMNARRNSAAWDRSALIAAEALAGDVYAPVGSATHYHANYVLPWWASSLAQVGQVGAHIFYRWRGAMEKALTFRQHYAGVEPEIGVDVASTGSGASGVTVHYGNRPADAEEPSGVTIHRGQVTPVAAVTRASFTSGVRIHRGLTHDGARDDGGEDATVSDEI
jgi:hypothetical protein